MEVLRAKTLSPQFFYGESYVDYSGNVSIDLSESSDGVTSGKVVSNLSFDLTDCYVFSNGSYAYVGDLASNTYAQVRLDRTHSRDTPDFYSSGSGEKLRFIKAMRPDLSRHILGTGLIGWMNKSALKTLIEMDMSEDYESLGMALVIVHL